MHAYVPPPPLSIPYHGSRLLRRVADLKKRGASSSFNTLPRVETAETRAAFDRQRDTRLLSIPYHGSRLLRPDAADNNAALHVYFQYPTTGRDC